MKLLSFLSSLAGVNNWNYGRMKTGERVTIYTNDTKEMTGLREENR